MLSLTIKDLKQFMNKLLISDTFDGMCLSEAYICTGCSYTIDGKLNTHFYNEDELNSMPSARYTSWKNIKPFAFSIIKGRKVPELLKITFVLPEAVVAKLILDTDLNFDPDCVNGLFLNVRYQAYCKRRKLVCRKKDAVSGAVIYNILYRLCSVGCTLPVFKYMYAYVLWLWLRLLLSRWKHIIIN